MKEKDHRGPNAMGPTALPGPTAPQSPTIQMEPTILGPS